MFKDKTIRKAVMAAINDKIDAAEETNRANHLKIDEDHEDQIAALLTKKENLKKESTNKLVSDILGKIL